MYFPVYRESSMSDVVHATAAGSWTEGLLPVLTHLAALPAMFYAWRIRAYRPLAAIVASFIASAAYHMCLAWPGAACFGLPLDTLRMGDYIWSPYLLPVGLEFMLRLYVYPWVSIVTLLYLFMIVFSALAYPFSIYAQLLILVIGAHLLFVKAVVLDSTGDAYGYVDRGGNAGVADLRLDRAQRFHVPYLLMALVLTGASFVGFAHSDPGTYWIWHSVVWHVCIYLALYFIMLGSSRDLPGWYDLLHSLSHAEGAKRDGPATGGGGDSPKVVYYSADAEAAPVHFRRSTALPLETLPEHEPESGHYFAPTHAFRDEVAQTSLGTPTLASGHRTKRGSATRGSPHRR